MKIIGWVFMALGVLFIGVGLWMVATAYASTTWSNVEGHVIERKVVTHIGQIGNGQQNRPREYNIEIVYQYQVNQVSHQASRYSLGGGDTVAGSFKEKSEAREWLNSSPYQVNQALTVYVDPDDPENTVLSAGINWATFIPIYFGLLLFVMGYFVRLIVPNKP